MASLLTTEYCVLRIGLPNTIRVPDVSIRLDPVPLTCTGAYGSGSGVWIGPVALTEVCAVTAGTSAVRPGTCWNGSRVPLTGLPLDALGSHLPSAP